MIRNYILVTFRNFIRNSNYAFINILGLSVGISACIVIFLIVKNEVQYDNFHSKYSSIYRIVTESKNASGEEFSSVTPYPVLNAFRTDYPDIPLATQVHHQRNVLAQIGDNKFMIDQVIFTDSLFFDVFDFEVVSGNPKIALGEPGQYFLTESLAAKMGIDLADHTRIKLDNVIEGEVVGIVKDPPVNSHIKFDMIVPYTSLVKDFIGGIPLDSWGVMAANYSYISLPAGMSKKDVETRLLHFVKKNIKEEDSEHRVFHLQPLAAIHFDEVYTDNPSTEGNSSKDQLLVMVVLGCFILFIGCINFVNLSTALAIKKSKEVGIRKTLGAAQTQLSVYFLLETFLITLIAVLLSLGLLEWILPYINGFLGKHLELNIFSEFQLPLFLLTLMLMTTLLSGVYPSLILSRFNPAVVLKNKITAQHTSGGGVRRVLVVFQFIIAQVLIICTLIISDQLSYFRNKPLGFNKDAVIQVPLPENTDKLLSAFRERLETNSNITSVSFSFGAPTAHSNVGTGYNLAETPNEFYPVRIKPVDIYYKDTYGLQMKAGRWFSEADGKAASITLPEKDRKYVYIVNETAVKNLGFSSPDEIIGKNIKTGIEDVVAEVVGVVSDFHTTSLHSTITPVVFMNFGPFFTQAGIKVNTQNLPETIKFIEKNWNDLYPDYYFKYDFLDQQLEELYREDERTFTVMKILAGVAIFVGCLGLYGLVSFMANQKLKEVGVRKVMGASVVSIVLLFSRDFIKLIVIAFAIAAPLGWYAMNKWLETFAYHIEIRWTTFVLSVFVTLVIALITVSYRSVKAAVANPSDTLRTE